MLAVKSMYNIINHGGLARRLSIMAPEGIIATISPSDTIVRDGTGKIAISRAKSYPFEITINCLDEVNRSGRRIIEISNVDKLLQK
jgi:hypothetical protein